MSDLHTRSDSTLDANLSTRVEQNDVEGARAAFVECVAIGRGLEATQGGMDVEKMVMFMNKLASVESAGGNEEAATALFLDGLERTVGASVHMFVRL